MVITRRRFVWAMVSTLVSAVAVAVFSVIYTGQSNEDNNRQWCRLLTTLNRAYSSEPPMSPLGREVAEAINGLTVSFGCEE